MGVIRAKSHLIGMIDRGQTPFGAFVCSLDPVMTELFGEAGFNFIILDAEHGRFARADIEAHARAASSAGVIPMVRVLNNDATLIQSMLDCGAQGIMVPHVDTADDAIRAVRATRYPPHGQRGTCAATYFSGYSKENWAGKAKAADENIMVIPIIESRRAVENIAEIVAVDGIDVVQFGHGDLAADSGYDFTTQLDLIQADFDRVTQATRAAGKKMMTFHGLRFDGGDMVLAGADYMIALNAFSALALEHEATVANQRSRGVAGD